MSIEQRTRNPPRYARRTQTLVLRWITENGETKICIGLTEIGAELGLSVKTISIYRRRLLEKLNFKSNAELVRYAMERGLVDEGEVYGNLITLNASA